MDSCIQGTALSEEVFDFIDNVNDVGEESITDFLVWKMRKNLSNFNSLNVDKHSRQYENEISGADFVLEFWILTNNKNFSFAFQAKKIVKDYNKYWQKLNYKNGSLRQLDMLVNYSTANKMLPFYIFYSLPDVSTKTKCQIYNLNRDALFIADAQTVDNIIVNYKKRKLSKNQILALSNPFKCFFCCPLTTNPNDLEEYIKTYFPKSPDSYYSNDEVPKYVYSILYNEFGDAHEFIIQHKLKAFRHVGVLDLRNI